MAAFIFLNSMGLLVFTGTEISLAPHRKIRVVVKVLTGSVISF
jgi:hypothetical protein